MEETLAWELRIEGRVQGVAYRWSARQKAEELGLVGWVRNEADGSVLCRVRGPAPVVEDFVAWCGKGPPAARVQRVTRRLLEGAEAAELEGGPGFSIRA